ISLFAGCGGDNGVEGPSCDGSLLLSIVNIEGAACGIPAASFEVQATGGAPPYQYRIDDGRPWGESGFFNDLLPAAYRVTVMDDLGCSNQISLALPNGISFQMEVEAIITEACATAGCHVTGEQAPDLSFRPNIFSAASRMRNLVDTRQMPPEECNCPLTEGERQKILCWIDDGGQDN
ncbi:MAG: hypothetical protein AAFU67_09055, partial [Bacteroidota bacterium]